VTAVTSRIFEPLALSLRSSDKFRVRPNSAEIILALSWQGSDVVKGISICRAEYLFGFISTTPTTWFALEEGQEGEVQASRTTIIYVGRQQLQCCRCLLQLTAYRFGCFHVAVRANFRNDAPRKVFRGHKLLSFVKNWRPYE
jgi:hypothetical protein